MAEIIYKPLSALAPIELKYDYYKKEGLQATTTTYSNGISLYEIEGLKNYKDIAINRDSCFVLTSSVNLSSVFTTPKTLTIGSTPVSILIGARVLPGLSPIYFAKYIENQDTFKLTLTSGSSFYLQPVTNKPNIVEMFVEGKYVQVDEEYPYVVKLNTRSLSLESINRQQFEIVFDKGTNLLTIKTLTKDGYRYLSFNNDNILRATGLILNETEINDYVMQGVLITNKELEYGFNPTNNWTTYYFDIESRVNNKNLVVNKNIYPIQTNFLVSFPIEQAAAKGSVNTNIANLKTNLTPSGGAAPINNAYAKEVITTN